MQLLIILLFSPAYFYCNWQYFQYIGEQTGRRIVRWKGVGATFAVNYILFIACSYLQLHLIVNWTAFAVFLVAETALLFRCPLRQSVFHGLTCALIGLSINILSRSVMAIVQDIPASAFDGTSPNNEYKFIPVAAAFILAGAVFQIIRKTAWMERVGTIAADPSNLKFSTRLITAMYCYLFLNLLVYYMPGNYLIFKIWVVKACISVLVGYYIATLYAFKMSRLNRYREQNHAAHEELLKRMQEENELHFLAYTDPLTGCCNRKYFSMLLTQRMEKRDRFCLCFADLDGLKCVNDEFGHQAGMIGGIPVVLAVLLYTLQIYAEFSGTMDIVTGVAQLFGVSLAENFRRPFFSRSVQEFWRRWHVTLGAWLRDYIFYPISFSKFFMNLSKKAKKNLNEHFGKLAPIAFSMFFVWFGNGIWHGASWKYVVYGLYYYLIMMIGLLFEPLARRLIAKAHINISSRGYRLWQMARTFLLVCFGMLIFRAKDLPQAFTLFGSVFTGFGAGVLTSGALIRDFGLYF